MLTGISLCRKMVESRSGGLGFSFLARDEVWVWLKWLGLSETQRVLGVFFLAPNGLWAGAVAMRWAVAVHDLGK
ncbi:hypothetical protein TorRG33x02_004610 [Trema orientale]|uniref:Uncharacterized protein n=1 Tax=Trema orientale TaxID=63057 RepID=A0A2P5G2B9_TREOI|nr:hypothetical protein TorRG33x02_004610 [Trema orientale]